jgi:V/A-type H+-transporting ATPase subunit G/H
MGFIRFDPYKGGEKMYLETIQQLEAVENTAEKEKQNAKAESARCISDAQKKGQALMQQAQERANQAGVESMTRAEAEAEAARKTVLAKAEAECAALRAQAEEKMDAAVSEIVRKVVNRGCQSQK